MRLQRFISVMACTALLLTIMPAPSHAEMNKKPDPALVTPPVWTQKLKINLVSERRCNITNAKGESFFIEKEGTTIDKGLVASRNTRTCSVTDTKGIRCSWGLSETLLSCKSGTP